MSTAPLWYCPLPSVTAEWEKEELITEKMEPMAPDSAAMKGLEMMAGLGRLLWEKRQSEIQQSEEMARSAGASQPEKVHSKRKTVEPERGKIEPALASFNKSTFSLITAIPIM